MSSVKRAIIMAGGTGGHIFPGLAVAEELKKQGWQVTWLGTAERMEAQLVPQHDIEIDFIDIKGVRNKGLFRKLLTPFMLLNAVWQAITIIKARRADIVIGFGGYAAMPGGLAAKLLAKPLVIHEQNAAAGLTNRVLSRLADRTLMAFANTKGLSANTNVVGNPVRNQIKAVEETALTELSILVVGGSLGAQVLNEQMPVALKLLVEQNIDVSVLHQTGRGNLASVKAAYAGINAKVEVVEFIDDMAAAYDLANLVVCRAGALTVSELAAAHMPSILVPLPHAVDDHQTKNAEILVNAGAGILLPQTELLKGELAKHLIALAQLPSLLVEMAAQCKSVAIVDSTERVVNVVNQLVVED
ncbi:undecaprenyldiphospho-muramoylpentapeptide beta-N-acetylglucosaminyltransferase [Algibacillus agarilyticus]|uniref:undecaprenyldiphospho-muramoylpentapeptide beta-N-acetylglucosaminyltransferase n=1 Tax=Algibacillus agarilyticus TaxID=2234133 RepID=UPI000DCFA240|nr:undecaprenyldiphospho-muramoylpentapeptide beta-N-acetylglucosaminyltransferase [Algibacillus agarilyticus]